MSPSLLHVEYSLGTFWTKATYVSVSKISSRAGLASAEWDFAVKPVETDGKGRWGQRQAAAPGQTGQWSTPIPSSDSDGNGPHISQPVGWDWGQNIILFFVELNITYRSPGLRKDCGLLLSWCIYWTNQCRRIPFKAMKCKDVVNTSGKSCCWRLGQYGWETSLPACLCPVLL